MHLGTEEDPTLAAEKLTCVTGILLQKPCKSFPMTKERNWALQLLILNLWKWSDLMIAGTRAKVRVFWNPKVNLICSVGRKDNRKCK